MGKSMLNLEKFIEDKSNAGENSPDVNEKLMESTPEKSEAPEPIADAPQETKPDETPSTEETKKEEAPANNTETQGSENSNGRQRLGDSLNKWAKDTITEDTAIGAGLALYNIVRVLIKAPVESYESLILTLYNTKQRKEVIPNWIGLTIAVLVLLVLKRVTLGEDITVWVIALLVSTAVILLMFGNIKPIKIKKE